MRLICITGLARAGKNSLADLIQLFLDEQEITSKQFSFAEGVKSDLEPFLTKFGLDVWTEDTELKRHVRPYMLAHGNCMRQITAGQHWIRTLEPKLASNKSEVKIITDLRFPNEAEWAKSQGAKIIHIKRFETCVMSGQRLFDFPPNEEESRNDPKVEKVSDFRLEWPKYGKIGEEAKELVFNFMSKNENLWK